jgi:hypothetical protein
LSDRSDRKERRKDSYVDLMRRGKTRCQRQAVGKIRQCVALGLAAPGRQLPLLLQWLREKPGRFLSNRSGSIRVVEVRRPCGGSPDHPGFYAIFRCTAYFFLAARPRPAGAARNEMPVRIAFC